MPYNDEQSNSGVFLPTNYNWDIAQLEEINVNSKEFKELLIRLYQNINRICLAINMKETAYYPLFEFNTNQQYFLSTINDFNPNNFRPVFRYTVDFGALPNTTSKSVAHNMGIESTYKATHIYGASTKNDTTSFIPLPYASPTDTENISLEITDTDIVITTGSDRTAYTTTYVVIEYTKL